MDALIAACLILIVLELGVLVAAGTAALLKVRDAAQAVEVAAYRADREIQAVGESLRSGWGAAARTLFAGAVEAFRRS